MANAVFTTSESSAYDDQPEIRYHFPRTYLKQAMQAEQDWILYYEPRRTSGPSSSTGRQAYFAAAWVDRIIPDPETPDHFYALIKHYMELDQPVPFRDGDTSRIPVAQGQRQHQQGRLRPRRAADSAGRVRGRATGRAVHHARPLGTG